MRTLLSRIAVFASAWCACAIHSSSAAGGELDANEFDRVLNAGGSGESLWERGNVEPASAVCAPRSAQCCSRPGTLLRWSYGEGGSGGPDLAEPLVTDRPDFTEASSTVGVGVAQIEMGYTYVYDSEGDTSVKTHSLGEPLLRYGAFADWFELRIALPPMQESTTVAGVSDTTTGVADLYLGAKIALTGQEGVLPEMAIVPQANVPTGTAGFSSESTEPGLNWLYSWEIDDAWSTAGSTQVNRRIDGGSGDGYAELAQSWTIGRGWSETLASYAEWFVLVPTGAETEKTEHYVNGGFTYLISNDVQFDIRAGKGLTAAADDYFLGTGLSIRYH